MELDEGLILYKETCPLGVIGIVFEARPEVISQVAALTLKSGNAVILKGGSEAAATNEVIVSVWRECLGGFPAVPADAIQLLRTREEFTELLSCDRDVDLIVPRGSYDLVNFVMRNSRIPVLGHGEGICHVYVDAAADLDKAVPVAFDAKVQGPAICNAAETLLVHRAVAKTFLPTIAAKLTEAGVEIRGCQETIAMLSGMRVVPATEKDWATEYSDLILSVKVVSGIDEAIAHINHFGSRHTDSIVTEDADAARRFMEDVDSAGVFQNASTRFSDGFNYGLGAEIGISNSKLHARGPMGLEGLTTYKYKLFGNGHTVADYSEGVKRFRHRALH
jgi:glutamate-5-semialdehyde dehydrogenase